MKKIVTILFGIIFVAVGIFVKVRGNNMAKKCTTPAVGTVVEIKQEEDYDSDNGGYTYTYYPVIEYEANGETVTKQYSTGSNRSEYRINDKVNILYNPEKVDEYLIEGDKTSNLFGIIFIVMGAVIVVAGIFGKIN